MTRFLEGRDKSTMLRITHFSKGINSKLYKNKGILAKQHYLKYWEQEKQKLLKNLDHTNPERRKQEEKFESIKKSIENLLDITAGNKNLILEELRKEEYKTIKDYMSKDQIEENPKLVKNDDKPIQISEFIKNLNRAIALNHNYADPYNNRGIVYKQNWKL